MRYFTKSLSTGQLHEVRATAPRTQVRTKSLNIFSQRPDGLYDGPGTSPMTEDEAMTKAAEMEVGGLGVWWITLDRAA
jgi:hypothetical protein